MRWRSEWRQRVQERANSRRGGSTCARLLSSVLLVLLVSSAVSRYVMSPQFSIACGAAGPAEACARRAVGGRRGERQAGRARAAAGLLAATARTYRDGAVHALDVGLLHQYLNCLLAQHLDVALPQRLAPLQLLNPLVQVHPAPPRPSARRRSPALLVAREEAAPADSRLTCGSGPSAPGNREPATSRQQPRVGRGVRERGWETAGPPEALRSAGILQRE